MRISRSIHIIIFTTIGVTSLFQLSTNAQTSTFNAVLGSWDSASNWSNGVPTSLFTAIIGSGKTAFKTGAINIANIQLTGGGTLRYDDTTTLDVNTVTGGSTLSGSLILNADNIGGTFTTITSSSTLTNLATIGITGSGNTTTLVNNGIIQNTALTGTMNFGNFTSLTNNGTIKSDSGGNISLPGTTTNTSTGTVTVSGNGNLSLNSGFINNGVVNQTGGNFFTAGSLSGSGTYTFNNVNFSNNIGGTYAFTATNLATAGTTGITVTSNGATFAFTDTNISGTAINTGNFVSTLQFNGTGNTVSISNINGSTGTSAPKADIFLNASTSGGSSLTLSASTTLTNAQTIGITGSGNSTNLVNNGNIQNTSLTGNTNINNLSSFTNNGTIKSINGGSFTSNTPFTNTGTVQVINGGSFNLSGANNSNSNIGSITVSQISTGVSGLGTSFINNGTIDYTGGNFFTAGNFSGNGTYTFNNINFSNNIGGTYAFTGTNLATAGTTGITVTSNGATFAFTDTNISGTAINTGNFVSTLQFNGTGNTVSISNINGSTGTSAPKADIFLNASTSGGSSLTLSASTTLTNAQTIGITGSGNTTTLINNGTIQNTSTSGTTSITGITDFTNNGIIKGSSGNAIIISPTNKPINTGTIDIVANSTMTFNRGLTQTSGSTNIDGTLRLVNGTNLDIQGGSITGSGTISAVSGTVSVINNGGLINPGNSPGILTINGNYTQNSGGIIQIEIADATSFDKLSVNGLFAMGGTLQVRLLNGYSPDINTIFNNVFTSTNTITGNFHTISVTPDSGTGWEFALVGSGLNRGLTVTSVAIPEPISLYFIIPGILIGFATLRNRKL